MNSEFTSSSSSSVHHSLFSLPPPQSKWKDKAKAEQCAYCHSSFSFLHRPHNCHQCGNVYCGDCSTRKFPIEVKGIPTDSRVCPDCYSLLEKQTGTSRRKPKEVAFLTNEATAFGLGETIASGAASFANGTLSAANSSVHFVKSVATTGGIQAIASGSAQIGKAAPVLKHAVEAVDLCQKIYVLLKDGREKHKWMTSMSEFMKEKEQMLMWMQEAFKDSELASVDLSKVILLLAQVHQKVGEINGRGLMTSKIKATDDKKNIDELKEEMNKALSVAHSSMIVETKQQLNALQAAICAQSNQTNLKELKRILLPIDCSIMMQEAVGLYQTGTRLSFREAFQKWVSDSSSSTSSINSVPSARRLFWLKGPPGSGKTIISAMLASIFPSSVAAIHFCKHDQSLTCSPLGVIRSIAFQLAEKLPSYQNLLVKLLNQIQLPTAEDEARRVWEELLVKPLSSLDRNTVLHELQDDRQKAFNESCSDPANQFLQFSSPGASPFVLPRRVVIIIDALDESENGGDNKLLKFLSEEGDKLPQWMGIFISSRPELPILKAFIKVTPEEIECDKEANQEDITLFLNEQLRALVSESDCESAVELIRDKSEGLFLYCRKVIEVLKASIKDLRTPFVSLEYIQALPVGLDAFYLKSMIRIEKQITRDEEERKKHMSKFAAIESRRLKEPAGGSQEEYSYTKLLSLFHLILNAFEPLSFGQISTLSSMSLAEVQRLLHYFHAFLRITAANPLPAVSPSSSLSAWSSPMSLVEIYHKSVKDWMTDVKRLSAADKEGQVFFVDQTTAHLNFARRCFEVLVDDSSVARSEKEISQFTPPPLRIAIVLEHVDKPIDDPSSRKLTVTCHPHPLHFYPERGEFECSGCTSKMPMQDGKKDAAIRFGNSYSCKENTCKLDLCSTCFLNHGGCDPFHIATHRHALNRMGMSFAADCLSYCVRFGTDHAFAAAEFYSRPFREASSSDLLLQLTVPTYFLVAILSFLAHPHYLCLRVLLGCDDSLIDDFLSAGSIWWRKQDLNASASEQSDWSWLRAADVDQMKRCSLALYKVRHYVQSQWHLLSIEVADQMLSSIDLLLDTLTASV